MKTTPAIRIRLGAVALATACALGMSAQQSLPAPGSGGGFGGNSAPAPGAGGYYAPNPGYGPGPLPGGGMGWGSPWDYPGVNVSVNVGNPGWQNEGYTTVMACGYDARGIWRTIPLRVNYQWNGVQYNVTVLSAWSPWTDSWIRGVDTPAYNTTYFTHGNTYSFYVPLATGTYYFNL